MPEAAPFGRGRLRRLLGLDRTGPPPPQVREGQPLNPWTIPNLVGFLRLAAVPAFLVVALESDDGSATAAVLLFFVIGAGDYVDGLLARLTGQYSRLGAMLDPLIDRLAALAGAIVCWEFELLPRWALAVLGARELVTLILAQYAVRHDIALRINWPGRIAVLPILGSIFVALISGGGWVATAMLLAGIALAIVATALYARDGLRALRGRRTPAATSQPSS